MRPQCVFRASNPHMQTCTAEDTVIQCIPFRVDMFVCMQIELGQMPQAAALFREALMDNPDDWTSLQQYLDCTLTISSGDYGGGAGDCAEGTGDQAHGGKNQDDLSNGMCALSLQDQQQVQSC